MDLQAGCWLITASVAPLVAVLSFWSLLTFHAYRRQWRTVDLFFVALVSQEFINAVFLLGHSLLNLTKPTLTPVCSLFGWASFVVRTFQVTTVTSLVLDRAMTIKWPYRYRLSVRRNQVRYHIVVTATIAVLVGVASMFANSEEDDSTLTTWYSGQKQAGSAIRPVCFLLPFALDKKFVLFIVVLHGILILSSLIFLIHVQVKLCSSSASPASASVNHIRIAHHLPNPFLTLESPTSTTIVPSLPSTPVSNGTTWPTALHTTGRSSFSLKRGSTKLGQDFRWKVVVTIVIICNLINHIPYLVR